MGLHEKGKFWEFRECYGAVQQLQKVPHVTFGPLKDIEIFEEVVTGSFFISNENYKPQIPEAQHTAAAGNDQWLQQCSQEEKQQVGKV